MQKIPLHPSEIHIGLHAPGAKNSYWWLWLIVIIAGAGGLIYLYKKHQDEKAKH